MIVTLKDGTSSSVDTMRDGIFWPYYCFVYFFLFLGLIFFFFFMIRLSRKSQQRPPPRCRLLTSSQRPPTAAGLLPAGYECSPVRNLPLWPFEKSPPAWYTARISFQFYGNPPHGIVECICSISLGQQYPLVDQLTSTVWSPSLFPACTLRTLSSKKSWDLQEN